MIVHPEFIHIFKSFKAKLFKNKRAITRQYHQISQRIK